VTKELPTEHSEAVALMKLVRMHEPRYPQLRLLFAVPNGGARNKIVAGKLKAEGVKAGVPDYIFPASAPGYIGLAVELKRLDGYASREQKQWVEWLRAAGWRVEVCRGADAAWKVIREYIASMQP
jgi:hypothetical protein